MQRFWDALKVLVANLLILVLLLELVGWFTFNSDYYWHLRFLSITEKSIVNNEGQTHDGEPIEFWTYAPEREIQSTAAYSTIFNTWVEYDCRFQTNSLGLIETGAQFDQIDFLVLGDSFTEGQGGCPWLTTETISESALSHLNLINGGLAGAGVQTFEQVLSHVALQGKPDNIAIVAISNDFKRGAPHGWVLDDPCAMRNECDAADYWHFIEPDLSTDDLARRAKERRKERSTDKQDILNSLRYYSFTVRSLVKLWNIAFADRASAEELSNLYDQNFAALERMRQAYPDMKIILVPQRDEVGFWGRENADMAHVRQRLSDDGVPYRFCELGPEDYMPIDGHPNKAGYSKLFDCLESEILN